MMCPLFLHPSRYIYIFLIKLNFFIINVIYNFVHYRNCKKTNPYFSITVLIKYCLPHFFFFLQISHINDSDNQTINIVQR